MNEYKKIFFSYSRIDSSDFVLKLATDLKNAGFNVWIDQQDIRAGLEWDLEIEKALETCDCLLFIESEKSVASNNVLDEVYYALEQQKRVIPIIYHDSKTPFRLQRLQHIDFSSSYEKGLTNLVSELKRDPAVAEHYPPVNVEEMKNPARPFFTKSSQLVILLSAIVVIITAAAFMFSKNAKEVIPKPGEKIETQNEDFNGDQKIADAAPKAGPQKESTDQEKKEEKSANIQMAKKEPGGTGKPANLNENFTGYWQLVDVDPKAASQNGYLKIEETAEKKVTIKSSFQFYYFKTNDTAFLSIFNGFAGCISCQLATEMKITAEDIAIATQRYRMLKEARPGGGKAGDTILSAGYNKSIRATVTLHLINNKTALIKVQRADAIALSDGIVLPPFVYSFRFTKTD